jgi:hypothetical protein
MTSRFPAFLIFCLFSLLQLSTDAKAPENYIRIHKTEDSEIQLQIAIREFKPSNKSPEGCPNLALVGVAHIGEKQYYQDIQTYLAKQEHVLYEGVGFYATKAQRMKKKSGAGQFGKEQAKDSSQYKIATSLGLSFQLTEINYNQRNFYNSDLSLEEFMEYFQPGTKNSLITGDENKDREAKQFMAMLAGSHLATNILQGVLKIFGQSPKFQGVAKLVLIETLGSMGNELGDLKNMPESVSGLMKMIITNRNKVVLQDFKALIKEEKRMDSIAIFYGAAHMADFEQKLTKAYKYKPAETKWLTCMSVNPNKSGLSNIDMTFIRNLIQRQLKLYLESTNLYE